MDPKINAAVKLINAYARDKSKDARKLMATTGKTVAKTYERVRDAVSDGGRMMVQDRRRMMLVGGIAVSATALGLILARTLKKKT